MSEETKLSVDDLDFEGEEVDSTKDAFELPAPVPANEYTVKLTGFSNEDADKRWTVREGKNGKFAFTFIDAEILRANKGDGDPEEYSGRKIRRFMVSTMIRDGASSLSTICTFAGNPVKTRNIKEQIEHFEGVVAGEPILSAIVDWEAQYKVNEDGKDVYKTVKKGMKNFPKLPNGKYNHKVETPSGEEVSANASILRFVRSQD